MTYAIPFQRGTSEPIDQVFPSGLAELLKQQLENPARTIRLVGYAQATEVASEPLRQRLAERRAQRAHQLLITAGISAQRLQLEVGTAEQSAGGPSDAPGVVLQQALT